jgi:uncharacterized protein YdiU (UPF0061 family)
MSIPTGSTIERPEPGWRFENTYAQLPSAFFAPATPTRVQAPKVAILSRKLATELGLNLDAISAEQAAAIFAGQEIVDGSKPIAQAYAGHQFGGFTMLGDGRAILLGEHRTPTGQLVDIQLKGAGQTPFSRRGDGRAALGPMLREYVISEAMAALGIPTTRSLAVVTTGEPVYREKKLRGAILTRVAASHIRVGTFEYLAARGDQANLRVLADYAIQRHYPELVSAQEPYVELLRAVVDRQASLIAKWQLVGFIHGVMNTDNMAISGETIDYGPCAFMNSYDPNTVFSSIDHAGRYAYANQVSIGQWNLARFAETLLPLIDADETLAIKVAVDILEAYPAQFERYWLGGMRRKLGLQTEQEGDLELARSLLEWMHRNRADYTNTFRALSSAEALQTDAFQNVEFKAWLARWEQRRALEGRTDALDLMRSANPVVIPRNHRVEEALAAAEERDDLTPLHALLQAVQSPYSEGAHTVGYTDPPKDECGYRTFCGT